LQLPQTLEHANLETAFNRVLAKSKWMLDAHKSLSKTSEYYPVSLNFVKETKRNLEKLQRAIEKYIAKEIVKK